MVTKYEVLAQRVVMCIVLTVLVECAYTASNVNSSSSSSAGVEVVQPTDFYAISLFRSAMALLGILHSDSVCSSLSQNLFAYMIVSVRLLVIHYMS